MGKKDGGVLSLDFQEMHPESLAPLTLAIEEASIVIRRQGRKAKGYAAPL